MIIAAREQLKMGTKILYPRNTTEDLKCYGVIKKMFLNIENRIAEND